MKIKCTDLNFSAYEIYLGAEKFDKGKVLEADEEEGFIIYEPKNVWETSQKTKREFGKVYIVRTV